MMATCSCPMGGKMSTSTSPQLSLPRLYDPPTMHSEPGTIISASLFTALRISFEIAGKGGRKGGKIEKIRDIRRQLKIETQRQTELDKTRENRIEIGLQNIGINRITIRE